MSKGRKTSNEDWVEYHQLQKIMRRQNRDLESGRRSPAFDPHKYFGGWTPIERSTIENIKKDKRLIKMMEYSDSDNSNNEDQSELEGKESLANPSVADEDKPAPVIPQLKTNNTKSNNTELYVNKPFDRQAMTGFRNA